MKASIVAGGSRGLKNTVLTKQLVHCSHYKYEINIYEVQVLISFIDVHTVSLHDGGPCTYCRKVIMSRDWNVCMVKASLTKHSSPKWKYVNI